MCLMRSIREVREAHGWSVRETEIVTGMAYSSLAKVERGSGLLYQGDGNWQYNWKTPKSYAGKCRIMRLNLADGAIDRTANFQFK